MEDPVQDLPKGRRGFGVKGIHEALSLVVYHDERDPRKTEEKEQAIQDAERGQGVLPFLFVGTIEPQYLRENNEGNGTVTGMKEERKEEGHPAEIYSSPSLQVLHKEVETGHSSKH